MGQLIVRNLDDAVKVKLQQRARRRGRSTEEEVRDILRQAVAHEDAPPVAPLGARIAARFLSVGLPDDLPAPPRQEARPADFE